MSLVARYKFNDASALTTDSSGNSNTLVNVAGVSTVNDATYGTVAYFTGNFNYFALENAPAATIGSSSRTVCYWVRVLAGSNKIFHAQATHNDFEYRVQFVNNNSIQFRRNQVVHTEAYPTVGQWLHISINYDGTTENIYLDGVLTNTATVSINTAVGPFWIGNSPKFPSGGSETMEGEMLDFRIYDEALSATDVATLFAGGPNPVPDPSTRFFNQLQMNKYSTQQFQFAEIEILDRNGTNIAPLGTVSGFTTESATIIGPAAYAIDGNTNNIYSNTEPSTNSIAIVKSENGVATLTLDLDRDYAFTEIRKIIVYNRLDHTATEWFIGVVITLHSSDGEAPVEIGVTTADLIQEFVVAPVIDFLLPTARATSISATVVEVAGASSYQINITESPSGTTLISYTGISTGDVIIGSLIPETTYVLQLSVDKGSGYVLEDTKTVTTLTNSAANYDKSVYGSNGVFDLSTLDSSSLALLDEVMNDLFATGDKLDIKLGTTTSDVAFVKVGEAVSTDDSILVPFRSTGGVGQAITMNLSDNSTVSVTYDDVNNSLNIGGSTVQVGDSIVIDGKKLTVKDL